MTGQCLCDSGNACGDWLPRFVSGVWENTDQMAGASVGFTSGWLLAPSNLGKLNNLIDTDFYLKCNTGESGVILSYDIEPCMNEGEQGIYSKLREYEFYLQQARWSMSGVGGSSASSAWTNIKEWNRSITQVNRITVTKEFRELAKEAREDLEWQVKMYLKFGAVPASVNGSDTEIGYYGGAYGADYGGGYPYGYNPRNFPQ